MKLNPTICDGSPSQWTTAVQWVVHREIPTDRGSVLLYDDCDICIHALAVVNSSRVQTIQRFAGRSDCDGLRCVRRSRHDHNLCYNVRLVKDTSVRNEDG